MSAADEPRAESEAAFASDVIASHRRAEQLHLDIVEAFRELHRLDRRCGALGAAAAAARGEWDDAEDFRRISDQSGLTALWAVYDRLGGTVAAGIEAAHPEEGIEGLHDLIERREDEATEEAAEVRLGELERSLIAEIARADQIGAWIRDQGGQGAGTTG